MKRMGITLSSLVCMCLLVLLWSGQAWAEDGDDLLGPPETPKSKKKKKKRWVPKSKRQERCLKRCYSKGYRRFYRCRHKGRLYCNMKAGIYFRACIRGCSVPKFCTGYQMTAPKCIPLCLRPERRKWL
ncbi:MAG TPA: hypothetical protein DCE42_13635, partial [Myxococcales bacterium]|nr:hypothetical protein [Myxococcales bacterium]